MFNELLPDPGPLEIFAFCSRGLNIRNLYYLLLYARIKPVSGDLDEDRNEG